METTRPRKRRWWSYLRLSVTSLMLVVLVVGIGLGRWVHLAHVQRKAVAAIRAAGGRISYEWDVPGNPKTPGWRRWVAEHVDVDLTSNVLEAWLSPRCGEAELSQVARLRRLEFLSANGAKVTETGMASLGELNRLQSLRLDDCPITDASLVQLEALTDLKVLSLARTPLTDAGMVHLKGLAELRNLQLAITAVGDTGLPHLSRLPRLQKLTLRGTRITDAGLVHLGKLTSLEVLDLSDTQVSGPGLAHLHSLTSLNDLSLAHTPVTDDGVAHLSSLSGLRELRLSGTRITDAGLSHLASLKDLWHLWIEDTTVGNAGLEHLDGLKDLRDLMADHTRITAVGEPPIHKSPWHNIFFDGQTASAKAEKLPVARGGGSVGSKDRILTPDGTRGYVIVNATDSGTNQKELVDFADGVVVPHLARIKGFDTPRPLANRHSALRIRLDPDRMGIHGLTSSDMIRAFGESWFFRAGERFDEAPGKTWPSKKYELITISRRYDNPKQYEGIILKASPEGEILRLRDVGQVELAPPFFDISSDIDGHLATAITLKAFPGNSAATATEAIKKDLQGLKATNAPPGMSFEVMTLENPDMIYAVIELPLGTTLENTSAKCQELGAIARGIDGVSSVTSLAGYEIRMEDHGLGVGTCLIRLMDRTKRTMTSRQIIEALEKKCRSMTGDHSFFEPPAVSVLVADGGFSVRVLDRAMHGDSRPGGRAQALMDDLLKHRNLEGFFTYLAGHYPKYELVINNDVARENAVSIADAMENLLTMMGGDVQDEGTFRRAAKDYWNQSVKNGRGKTVPYNSFLQLRLKPPWNARGG
ncbi:leucine-rich repeat domain-containing protein [Singulisphaera rosea]